MPTPEATTPAPTFEIPDEAIRAFARAIDPTEDPFKHPQDVEVARAGLAAAAPLLVAAAFRTFSQEMTAWGMIAEHAPNQAGKRMLDLVARRAAEHADELDGTR